MDKGIIFTFFLHCVFFLLHLFFLLYIHGRNILERFMGWKGPAPPAPTPDPPLPKLDSDEDFHITGPRHMMTISPTETIEIDWDKEEHRRCITACLVRGTYVLDSERTKSREASDDTRAPAWWESFHFRKLCVLECECECVFCQIGRHIVDIDFGRQRFIYGAIFEYVPPGGSPRHPSAPSYVVAFRGTMRRDATTVGDMRLNLRILLNAHHSCGRFSHAREKVREFLNSTAIPNGGLVWMAGHSLGASIALDVGRDMMAQRELNLNIPTFLFNPPHVSLAAAINDELPMAKVAKIIVTSSSYFFKHGLGTVLMKRHKEDMGEQFKQLSPWIPNLYVHRRDFICKGFIDYFEKREQMHKLLPSVAASGTTLSYRDMCLFLFGMHKERPHLLPSAMLWENQSSVGNPHELRRWWLPQGPELVLSRKAYKWPA